MAKKETKSAKSMTRAKTPKPAAATRKAEASTAQEPGTQEPKRARKAQPHTGRIKVTLVRSTIGFDRKQAAVVRGLGLRGIRHTVDVIDTPAMRGMIHKVRHLVEVQ